MSELIIDKITTRDGSNVGAIVVADIDELLLLNTNKEINTTAIVKDSNRGGVFNYDGAQSGVNNGGTIFNGWVRQYDGAVNVKWFGASISRTDNEVPIQSALGIDNNIEVTDATFNCANTIYITSGTKIAGNGAIKSTNASVPILKNNTGGTVSGVTIKGVGFTGSNNTIGLDLGIFALSYIEDVTIADCLIGLKSSDMWQVNLTGVVCRNITYVGDIGFDIADGTSTAFNRCWSKKNNIGYNLGSLKYSSLTSCACDTFTEFAYTGGQSITFVSCGAEGGELISGGAVYNFGARQMTIVGGQLLSISSTAPSGEACIFRCNGTQLDIIGFRGENAISGTNIDGITASAYAKVELKNSILSTLNVIATTTGTGTRVKVSNAGTETIFGGAYEFNEMPTVDGASIVSSGSNANGEYVRYADGTQICYNNLTGGVDCTTATTVLGLNGYTTATPLSWTYPLAFSTGTQSNSFTALRSDRTTSVFMTNAYNTNTNFVGISVLCSGALGAAYAPTVRCMAIGKWK